jgi:hypothetical protein
VEADLGVVEEGMSGALAVDELEGVAGGAWGAAGEEDDVLGEGPGFAGIAEVVGGVVGVFEVGEGGEVVAAEVGVDEGDGTAGGGVVFGEGGDEEPGAWDGTGIEEGFGEDEVVGVEGVFVGAIGVDGPEGLDGEGVFIDVLPATEDDAAVGEDGGVEFIDVIDGDGVEIGAIGVHDMEDGDAGIVAGDETAGAGGEEDDTAVGEVGGGDIVLALEVAVIIGAGGGGIGETAEVGAVEVDLVDGRAVVGGTLIAEEEAGGVPGQFGVGVHAGTEGVGGGVDDGSDAPLVAGCGGVFEDVDAAAAGGPFVVGIVDVDTGVGMAFDEEEGGVEEGGKGTGGVGGWGQ